MSARKNEQDEAVDWDYDKMTNGVNVKFPPLDSDDLPHDYLSQYDLRRLRNVWNKHSRHWDLQHKIDFFDYLWDPSVTQTWSPWDSLYSERSKFSAYVILKCLYPSHHDLSPHRLIRWGRYPAIDGDELRVGDWGGNLQDEWGNPKSRAQGNQWSGEDVEAVNVGVRNSAQDEPDESLKTKNKVTAQWGDWGNASLPQAFGQQNNKNADGPYEEVAMPVTCVCDAWGCDACPHEPPPSSRPDAPCWSPYNETVDWKSLPEYPIYVATDSKNGRTKEVAHQESSIEDDRAYDRWGSPYLRKRSGRSACPSKNAFASKFSSETEDSEVGVITPASSNAEQAPALSGQQIQELKDFITKTNNDTVAHLSLEMSHMKRSLDEKIEQMREDFNLRLNRAMKVNLSLRDDLGSLQLSLPDNPTTQQQVRELEARVANLEQWCPDF